MIVQLYRGGKDCGGLASPHTEFQPLPLQVYNHNLYFTFRIITISETFEDPELRKVFLSFGS